MSKSSKANWSDLAIRLVSALVMAALALATNWLGGRVFALFWLIAALAVLVEWLRLVMPGRASWPEIGLGSIALAVATLLADEGRGMIGLIFILVGAMVLGGLATWRNKEQPLLIAAALPYAAAVVLPVLVLRQDEPHGSNAILVLFAIVWGSDIMAYFTGRTLGGPKLCPRISPKKTWSGFVGGLIFGGLGAGLVGGSLALVLLGGLLAAISQGGDLVESALKRRFDAKDASHLIPGHGGVMDRLDGFLAAALTALIVGVIHGGGHPAHGLLAW
jgi:phosphatidate cytidylyltransferase